MIMIRPLVTVRARIHIQLNTMENVLARNGLFPHPADIQVSFHLVLACALGGPITGLQL